MSKKKKDMYIMLNSINESLEKGEEALSEDVIVIYESIGLSEEYGGKILKELVDNGLVEGFKELEINKAPFPYFKRLENQSVTLRGIDFLEENSSLSKFLSKAKDFKDATPFI